MFNVNRSVFSKLKINLLAKLLLKWLLLRIKCSRENDGRRTLVDPALGSQRQDQGRLRLSSRSRQVRATDTLLPDCIDQTWPQIHGDVLASASSVLGLWVYTSKGLKNKFQIPGHILGKYFKVFLLVEQVIDYLRGGRIGSEEESLAFLLGLVCLGDFWELSDP